MRCLPPLPSTASGTRLHGQHRGNQQVLRALPRRWRHAHLLRGWHHQRRGQGVHRQLQCEGSPRARGTTQHVDMLVSCYAAAALTTSWLPRARRPQGATITINRCMDQTHGAASGAGGCYATLLAAKLALLPAGNAVSPVSTALAKTCPAGARGCSVHAKRAAWGVAVLTPKQHRWPAFTDRVASD